ncbi:MAG: hypothetical protein K9G64_06045 [Bacteroidia bacterium]|nr:hypothetical protein [Bacteroidia bacterium]
MKQITKLLYLFIFCMAFSSCTKDNDECKHGEVYYNLAADELGAIPYKDFDTLTFIRTHTNDTFIFYANAWQSGNYKSTTKYDCYDYEFRESKKLNFYNSKLNLNLKIEQFIPQNSFSTSHMIIEFTPTFYYYYINEIITGQPRFDTLTIQNKSYKNVYLFDNVIVLGNKNYKCYYNKEYGIVKMELQNGEIWELITNK